MKRKAKVDWVTMGPHPFFATCQRCGQRVDPPKLPMPISAFVKYGEYAMELHRHCEENESAATVTAPSQTKKGKSATRRR